MKYYIQENGLLYKNYCVDCMLRRICVAHEYNINFIKEGNYCTFSLQEARILLKSMHIVHYSSEDCEIIEKEN